MIGGCADMLHNPESAFFRIISAEEAWNAEIKRQCENQENHCLIYLLHGVTSTYIVNNELQDVKNHTLLYIPKGASWTHEATREKRITIYFDDVGAEKNMPTVIASQLFVPVFRLVAKLFREKPDGYLYRANAQLFFIFELCEKLSRPTQKSLPQYQAIQKGVEFLRKNYKDPSLRISDLASMCYIGERRFRDLYKECFMVTPKETLIELRIKHACQLLQNEQIPIAEVALASGFTDAKHFSHCFRSIMQCSASTYRKLTTE